MAKKHGAEDTKRDEFRKYLEESGILESLTKSLVSLYEAPDKPTDALKFLRNNFVGQNVEELQESVKKLTLENKDLNARIDDLTKENTDLKEKLAAIKTQQAEAAAAAATEKEAEKTVEPTPQPDVATSPKPSTDVGVEKPDIEEMEVDVKQDAKPVEEEQKPTAEGEPSKEVQEPAQVAEPTPATETESKPEAAVPEN